MKVLKFILITLIWVLLQSVAVTGQKPPRYSFKLKEHVVPLSLVTLGGVADGFNQAIQFHYDRVDSKLHLHDQFWNPGISWTNKYKLHDPTQGPKYIGSTGPLVFVTDGYHLTRFIQHLSYMGAISVKVTQQKKKWYVYAAESAAYWLTDRVAFSLTYNAF